jgi:sn-glycerol 3-phosphate transport system permease protein
MSTTATRMPKSVASRPTGRVTRPAQRRRNLKNALLFFALLAPNLIVILTFSYWPTLYNFYLSFTDWDMVDPMPEFIGLENYADMFTDGEFGEALIKTTLFTVIATLATLIGGLALGTLLASKLRFSGIVRTLSFTPHMLPGAAVGMLWLFMFDPNYGLSRVFFGIFGAESPQWTTTSAWSIWSITIAYIWQRLGFVTIIYYTAILDLPRDVYEAAALDGATGRRLHRDMTLPLISPVTLFLSITGVISAAQAFDLIAVLTGGGPGTSSTTLSWYIYDQAFLERDVGASASGATVMFVLLLILTFIQLRIGDRKVHYS